MADPAKTQSDALPDGSIGEKTERLAQHSGITIPANRSPFAPATPIELSRPLPDENGVVFEYRGEIYNRPSGRGVALVQETELQSDLSEKLPPGNYWAEIVIHNLP